MVRSVIVMKNSSAFPDVSSFAITKPQCKKIAVFNKSIRIESTNTELSSDL